MTHASVDAFLATMVTPALPISIERIATLICDHYALDPRAQRLTGERDENFRLTVGDGAEYLLKIANPAEDPDETALQIAALLHIEKADPELPCPRVVRNRNGETHFRFVDEGGMERTARVLTYLPGRLVGASRRSRRQRAGCGRLGARLALALRGFDHRAAERTILWDVRHTGHMRVLLEDVPHFPYQSEVRELLERIVPRIDSQLPHMRHQIVHNDLNALNILVDPADEDLVTGVIDFGDMTRTALIADVGVCAAELIPGDCSDAGAAQEAVVDVTSGYHGCVPLLQTELAVLGALVAARLLMTLVIHEWHVQRNPGNHHYKPLDKDFMRMRLHIAERSLAEEIRL